MTYLSSMLAVLAIGVFILMTGILLNKEPGQSSQNTLFDSVMWGIGFLLSFGTEFWVLGSV